MIGVVGAAAGAAGSSAAAGASREAAAINNQLAIKFRDRNQERLEGLSYEQVDPLSFQEQAAGLTSWGRDIMRTAAYGEENLAGADLLRSSLLRQANFDFSDLPPDMLRSMDQSALARSFGGPGGLAENISLKNRIGLANRGLQGFQSIAGLESTFTPNPVTSLWDLAKFETSQRVTSLELDRWRVAQQASIDEATLGVQTGATNQRAANNAAAVNWTGAGQVLQSVGTAVSGYNTGATQQANSSALQSALAGSLSSLGGGGSV